MKIFLKNKLKENWFFCAVWLLIAFFIILTFLGSLIIEFDHDELEAVHTAWKISTGEKIYTDFFQHHHPLFYWLLVPFIKIFGETVTTLLAMRVLMFVFTVLILFTTYKTARLIFNKNIALLSLFFLASTYFFFSKTIEIRPDIPQVLFGLLAIFFLFNYLISKKFIDLALSALTLAISFLFLQKAVFLIILIFLVLFWEAFIKKRIPLGDLVFYSFIFALSLLPFYVYMIYNYSLSDYIFFNWTLNAQSPNHFPPYEQIFNTLKQNTVLWVSFFFGLTRIKKREEKLLGFITLGLVFSVALARSPFPQYFLVFLPLVAAGAAWSIYSRLNNKKLIFILILLGSATISSYFFLENVDSDNKKQLKKITYVISNTDRNDYVYDGDILFNIYRKDIDYFWYSLRPRKGMIEAYRERKSYHYDVYESIEKYQPRFISRSFIDIKDSRITEHYERAGKYEDLLVRKD